ncbi:MAG: hypothetical protein ACRD3D_15165 [Terriglobia bacterium]
MALRFLYGLLPDTLRGKKMKDLWFQCSQDQAAPEDPRALQILALLAEERAAFDEEEALAERWRELQIEQPESSDWPELRALDEDWQQLVSRLERLDRQINAKVRLLLRLEHRASHAVAAVRQQPGSAELFCNSAASLQAHAQAAEFLKSETLRYTKTDGTKPTKPLESTEEIETGSADRRSYGPWFVPAPEKAADLNGAGLRYPLVAAGPEPSCVS